MNPAPSVIIFTVLSGLGFGYLALLAIIAPPVGLPAFLHWGIGFALAGAGLISAAFHLGNPQRALLAFTQWRSSWLSREAWSAVATLVLMAPVALSDWLGLGWPRLSGWLGVIAAGLAITSTSMIYAQIRAVPRWHHPSVPVVFFAYTIAGTFLLAGLKWPALLALTGLAVAILWHWQSGDQAFARSGSTMGTATGLGRGGDVSVFELPHTGGNYLLHEMIYVVGRRHAQKLRNIAFLASVVAPAVIVLFSAGWLSVAVALSAHLLGAFAQRWLFFAEAEHVVGLYYGRR
ncbi:dimethyl sulfoxide reductase anchor subunit family protein [Thioclava sp. FR2]|uniref:dimethyl sulfoxide reductase anchor subunit family protein n=1 Tax=Thioclava sp. FR2 TaxID=3445780 RepID=UPI003EBA939D